MTLRDGIARARKTIRENTVEEYESLGERYRNMGAATRHESSGKRLVNRHEERRDDTSLGYRRVERDDIDSLAEASLASHNALHRRRARLTFEIGGRPHSLTACHAPMAAPATTLGMTLGEWRGSLTLATAQLEQLTTDAGLTAPLEGVDDDLTALWLENRLLPLIEAFETAFECSLTLHANAPCLVQANTALALELDADSFSVRFVVSLPSAGANWLMEIVEPRAPLRPAPASRLVLPLARIVGFQDITLSEWRSLRCGDAVILRLDDCLLLANRFRAAANDHADGSVLSTPLTPTVQGGYYMATSPPEMPGAQPEDAPRAHDTQTPDTRPDDAALDQIPVRLVCEVGRLEMPLGEVRALGEGSVVALSRPLDSVVDLVINGRKVGRGSLVNIGEAVGVRVDQLALED